MSLTLTRRYNVDRFGYLIPTKYGNVPMVGAVATYRPGEGRFGGAVAVEKGTTNLCPPLTQFSKTDYRGKTATVITDELITTTCIDLGDTAFGVWSPLIPIVGNTEYTFSFLVRSDGLDGLDVRETDANYRTFIGWHDSEGSFISSSTLSRIDLTNNWKKVVITGVAPENATHARLRLGADWPNIEKLGGYVEFKKLQFESNSFATSYTENTRPSGRLNYTGFKGIKDFTVRGCYRFLTFREDSWQQYLFSCRSSNQVHYYCCMNDNGTRLAFNRNLEEDSTWVYEYVDKNFELEKWYDIAFTGRQEGDRAIICCYIDGEKMWESNRAGNLRPLLDTIYVGTSHNNSSHANALIDELLILPYAASEEEIASWYEAQGPLPPHPQALLQWDRQAVRPAQMVKL